MVSWHGYAMGGSMLAHKLWQHQGVRCHHPTIPNLFGCDFLVLSTYIIFWESFLNEVWRAVSKSLGMTLGLERLFEVRDDVVEFYLRRLVRGSIEHKLLTCLIYLKVG